MSTIDIHRSALISLLIVFDTTSFKAMFNSLQLSVKSFLKRVLPAAAPGTKRILEIMEFTVSRKEVCTEEVQSMNSENLTIRDLETWQILQVHEASLALHRYSLKYSGLESCSITSLAKGPFPSLY